MHAYERITGPANDKCVEIELDEAASPRKHLFDEDLCLIAPDYRQPRTLLQLAPTFDCAESERRQSSAR
eukprot:4643115-Prymnesium_polylepis.1